MSKQQCRRMKSIFARPGIQLGGEYCLPTPARSCNRVRMFWHTEGSTKHTEPTTIPTKRLWWPLCHRLFLGEIYPSMILWLHICAYVDLSRAFSNLGVGGGYFSSIRVAVSSRVSCLDPPPEADKPLRGTRFAVKDIFGIQGLQTTAGNRDFLSVSPPAAVTCPAIQRLLDAGAELSGTLRLGSLIAREEPTESVDFQAPFNPRGDGYQSAWSSSGGSGAAIAAYEWLDFTIAQDSTTSPFSYSSIYLPTISP